MELELGLGLGLGLALPSPHPPPLAGGGDGEFVVGLLGGGSPGKCEKKRPLFDRAAAVKATLPLFVHDGGGGDGGGSRDGVIDRDEPSNKKKRLVGWPPVKCALRRGGGGGYVKVKMEGVAIGRKVDVSLHGSYQDLLRTLERMFPASAANQHGAGAGADADRRAEEEEEVASHERPRRHPYVVTYEDGEGDWMLVGDDVPWEVFVKSVKRLKILA